jgi:hypothetical protein
MRTSSTTFRASHVEHVLDEALLDIRGPGVSAAFEGFVPRLDELFDAAVAEARLPEFKHACQAHPAWTLFQEDPYTHRAFAKPRGYAGDAVMLDYVYSRSAPPSTSPTGIEVFEATTGKSIGHSVRFRRDIIAARISALLQGSSVVTIASVACGHLREIPLTTPAHARVIAIDQDPRSLAVVEREHPGAGLATLNASVIDLLRGRTKLPPCDLIYCSGLFDYLSDRLAERLTQFLLERLKVGGTLLIANFAPGTYGRGYLSGVMDWDLVFRDERALGDLFGPRGPATTWRDPEENIVFAEATCLRSSVLDPSVRRPGEPEVNHEYEEAP